MSEFENAGTVEHASDIDNGGSVSGVGTVAFEGMTEVTPSKTQDDAETEMEDATRAKLTSHAEQIGHLKDMMASALLRISNLEAKLTADVNKAASEAGHYVKNAMGL